MQPLPMALSTHIICIAKNSEPPSVIMLPSSVSLSAVREEELVLSISSPASANITPAIVINVGRFLNSIHTKKGTNNVYEAVKKPHAAGVVYFSPKS